MQQDWAGSGRGSTFQEGLCSVFYGDECPHFGHEIACGWLVLFLKSSLASSKTKNILLAYLDTGCFKRFAVNHTAL